MENHSVYVNSLSQISVQNPLCDDWTAAPRTFPGERLVNCLDPDFKQLLPANVVRRNSKVLRRAMVVSQDALKKSGLSQVDGVFTGSGLGCVESTEAFLQGLVYSGEEFLKPTQFMQSTHNTISSVIGIALRCNGYNTTYCHKGISFESALLDAYLQLTSGKIASAFVCGFDEMSATYHSLLCRSGYFEDGGTGFAGESAAGGVISTLGNVNRICRIAAVRIVYTKDKALLADTLSAALCDAGITIGDIDAVMTGVNGYPSNDAAYFNNLDMLNLGCRRLGFAHIFGESYSGSVYGFYASALCLQSSQIFSVLDLDQGKPLARKPENILIYRHFNNKDHAFIILRQC